MVNPRLTELCGGLTRYEADWKWTNEPSTSSTVCISTREPFIAQSRIWSIERLARDPQYFAKPERSLFQDIRRYFPITAQAQVAWAVNEGVTAACAFIEEQIEAGAFDGGVPRCHATTRKGKPCQRTPLPERDYCPSHQHLETRSRVAA
jgi:hypothetical protein